MIRQAMTGLRLVVATSSRDAILRRGNTWHQPSPQTHQIYVTLVVLIHQVHNRCVRITSVAKHAARARWSSNRAARRKSAPYFNCQDLMLSWSHSRAGNSGIGLNRCLAAQAAGHGVRHGPDSGVRRPVLREYRLLAGTGQRDPPLAYSSAVPPRPPCPAPFSFDGMAIVNTGRHSAASRATASGAFASGTLPVRDTSHRHDGDTMARDEARRDDRAGGAGGRLRQRH